MDQPRIYEMTKAAIARVLGMSLEELEHAWKTTPVKIADNNPSPLQPSDALKEMERIAHAARLTRKQIVEHFSSKK
jgi:hypothetical protein